MLRTQIDLALKNALKEKDNVTMSTVRLIKAATKDKDIAARDKGNTDGISDEDILAMLQSMIKQREESYETYKNAEREDLAEREAAEIAVIKKFLPEPLEGDALDQAIDSAVSDTSAESIRDMGKVMAYLKQHYPGQIDMGKAGAAVKQKLA